MLKFSLRTRRWICSSIFRGWSPTLVWKLNFLDEINQKFSVTLVWTSTHGFKYLYTRFPEVEVFHSSVSQLPKVVFRKTTVHTYNVKKVSNFPFPMGKEKSFTLFFNRVYWFDWPVQITRPYSHKIQGFNPITTDLLVFQIQTLWFFTRNQTSGTCRVELWILTRKVKITI
jgi:hypothetical protein